MKYKIIALVVIGAVVAALTYSAISNACGLPKLPPKDLMQVYYDSAREHPEGLNVCELMAQGWFESRFDPTAKSPAGAMGIAQFEPQTAEELGVDPFDPVEAIHAQAEYMQRLMHVWHRHEDRTDRVALALGSYNWGIGNMLHNQLRHDWTSWQEAVENLPNETQNYVIRILRASR